MHSCLKNECKEPPILPKTLKKTSTRTTYFPATKNVCEAMPGAATCLMDLLFENYFGIILVKYILQDHSCPADDWEVAERSNKAMLGMLG